MGDSPKFDYGIEEIQGETIRIPKTISESVAYVSQPGTLADKNWLN